MTKPEISKPSVADAASSSAPPRPLERDEIARLWRWERGMVRLSAAAIMVLAAGFGAAQVLEPHPVVRLAVLGLGILLLAGVVVMQIRERCPRCGSPLGRHLRLVLPETCGRCGVAFPRPIDAEGEIDN